MVMVSCPGFTFPLFRSRLSCLAFRLFAALLPLLISLANALLSPLFGFLVRGRVVGLWIWSPLGASPRGGPAAPQKVVSSFLGVHVFGVFGVLVVVCGVACVCAVVCVLVLGFGWVLGWLREFWFSVDAFASAFVAAS